MIRVKNLYKSFGKQKAIDDVSFEISQGEIIGFLGKNGAGKTTLMRMLTSYLHMTSGTIEIFGQNIKSRSLEIRRRMGYLPENPPLYEDMTVKNYLKYAADLRDIPSKRQKVQIDKVMDICKIKNVSQKKIRILSKGYKQRIGIAQAIIHEPELLILDEPTNGLDPTQIIQAREIIKNLENQRTVMISTHILSEIEQLADRVLILKEGKIVADNPLSKLLAKDGKFKEYQVRLIGKTESLKEALQKLKGVKLQHIFEKDNFFKVDILVHEDVKDFNEMIAQLVAKEIRILGIQETPLTLEQVFLNYHK